MTYDEAWVRARAERDVFIGGLLRVAARYAQAAHKELGLPDDVLLVFDESGVHTEPKPHDWLSRAAVADSSEDA